MAAKMSTKNKGKDITFTFSVSLYFKCNFMVS